MIHELRPPKQLEELDRARVPAGNIARQLFEDGSRPFTAPVTDRVGHLRARRQLVRPDGMERAITDQIADVWQNPRCASLDELVVVKLFEVFFENAGLLCDEGEQLAERFALLDVAYAMDRRKQVVELVRIVAHGIASNSIGAGSRVSNSAAPNDSGLPPLGRSASRRSLNFTTVPR